MAKSAATRVANDIFLGYGNIVGLLIVAHLVVLVFALFYLSRVERAAEKAKKRD